MSIQVITKSQTVPFWKEKFYNYLNIQLDKILETYEMKNLSDITQAIFKERSEILGRLILGFIEKKFSHLLNQEICYCPQCGKKMQRDDRTRPIETLVGLFELNRPYFYCRDCHFGFAPLDEALELSDSKKQYDIQNVETWLSSEIPYETASETYERITGLKASEHHMFDTVNNISDNLTILDVCPTKAEIAEIINNGAADRFRKPIVMIALDGAHAPTRPEPTPHPHKGKRGANQWKEVKGFRIYLLDNRNIIHLISWHQICDDKELAKNLLTIKEAGLIPEDSVRIGIIGDGAPWIWNRCKEIFPGAKEILDYYHCSEYVHDVANAYYGKGTKEAQSWSEATLTRLYFGKSDNVLAGLARFNAKTEAVQKIIDKFTTYLKNHSAQMHYDSAKRGGYHIGSGAIESANKFISHARIKRSGASWYIDNANNMLKIRCAKYNGTYDKIITQYKQNDQVRIWKKKQKPTIG